MRPRHARALLGLSLVAASAAVSPTASGQGATGANPGPAGPETPGPGTAVFGSSAGFLEFGRRSSPTDLPSIPVGTASYRHDFDADFDDLPGGLSVDELSLWTPLPPLSWDRFHLVTFFGYRATWLDGGGGSLVPDDDLHAFRLPVTFVHDMSDRFLWGAMVMPGYSSDLGSGSGDDPWSISAAAGAGYVYGPRLRLFAGAFYSRGVDNDDFLIPGVAFTWRPHPDWEAYLLPPVGGVSYSLNENWLVGLFGRYDSTAWAVGAEGTGPDVAVTLRGARVGLKLEGKLWDRFWLYGAGGYSFGRELEVESIGGRGLLDEDVDGSPFVQVGLNFRY